MTNLTNVLQFAAEHGDYVVGGDYADQFIVFIDYRKSDEVVLVEKLGDHILVGALVG